MDSIIKSSFWTDARVEEQPPEVKLACLWLISNPSRDICGFTNVSNKRFTFETGLSASPLEGACKGLPSSFREVVPGVYFAVHFLRHQFGKGGRISLGNKVIVAAARHAAKLQQPLFDAFFEAYPELVDLLPNPVDNPNKFDPPSIPLAENRHGVRVRVREGVREKEEGCGGEPGHGADIPGVVALYPKREKMAEAIEALSHHLARGADLQTVADATRAHAAVIARLPGGHLNAYVPSAATFFRNRRWEDDPQTWLRNTGKHANGAPEKKLDLGGRRPASNSMIIE